jgi:hypothetical protein
MQSVGAFLGQSIAELSILAFLIGSTWVLLAPAAWF